MKFRLVFLIAFCFSLLAEAQVAMTDEQVLRYVVEETQKGTSQQQMASELIKKGVTAAQLQRVRKKAEELKKQEGTKSVDAAQLRAEEVGAVDDENEAGPDFVELTEDEQQQVFGRNIFRSKKLTFEASANLTTPANYVLGVGDKLLINIWGATQNSFETVITADGYVVIASVGPIKLAGLTVERAKAVLKSKLGAHYGGTNIDFSLVDVRSVQVQVMGEVVTPGTYTLSGLSSAFNALYKAGGISEIGSLRDIKVYRNGKVVSTIDVYDFILHGNSAENVRLEDNDVIIVGAYNNLVQVEGSVKRPMWYELKNGETVADLITFAGNFTGNAYKKKLRVSRKSGAEYSVHTVNEERMSSFQLSDGDQVHVDSIRARYMNRVEVKGAVKYPGVFELGDDIKTVRQLLMGAEGFSENAYEGLAIMHRENEDLTIRMMNVDVHGILNGTSPDVPLKNNDVLFIPSKTDMLGERVVEVMGEVVTPGSYPYADNSTLQDIILQSGGLTEAGSLAKVDVYRRVKDAAAVADGVIRSEVFNFSLDERYAVQQDTTFYLHPYDIVIVRKSPIYEVQRSVVITGEVNFDGSYIIANENYRLSDLIKACGGMTNMAYVKGARLTRRMNANELEQREYADLIAQIQLYENGLTEGKNLDMQIAEELYKLKKNKSDKYVVAMDLQRAIDEPGSSYDLLLREGDVIEIPKQMTTIKVSGEVMGEISMPYEEGKSVKYYIKHAGGYTEGAATSRIYGINANGGVVKLKKSSKKAIQPGMEIVVPKKNMRRKLTTGEIIGIGSGVASLASVVIALINTTSK